MELSIESLTRLHPSVNFSKLVYFSRPGVLTRRKKESLKSILRNKETRARNKAILFCFNQTGSSNSKTADMAASYEPGN